MKIALLATDRDYSLYARCLGRLGGRDWIGSCVQSALSGAWVTPLHRERSEPPVSASPDSLIERADVVVAAGAAASRFEYVSRVLRKGKAVWTLWPMARTLSECRKLAALADEACVRTRAFRPGLSSPVFRAFMAAGLPPVRMAGAEIGRRAAAGEDFDVFMQEEFFPGLDRVLAVTGSDVRKVSAQSLRFGDCIHARMRINLEMNSGAEAVFDIDRVAESNTSVLRLAGPDFSADLDFAHPKAVLRRALGSSEVRPVSVMLPLPEIRPLEDDLSDFISGGIKVRPEWCKKLTFADGTRVQGVYEEILRKIKGHE